MQIPGAPSVHERFEDAKLRYESVIREKGTWFDNWSDPSVYKDAATEETLLIARVLLVGIENELRHIANPDSWLLHLAGVHWQSGLIELLNGDFERASRENSAMREIIPTIPRHLWRRHQQSEYESNAAFLDGEIALGRGEREFAISQFKQSLAIDESIGNRDGAARCSRYLTALGANPERTVLQPQPTARLSVGFFFGKTAFLVVAFGTLWGLGQIIDIDVWHPVDLRGLGLVVVSIVAGVVADRLTRRLIGD